MKNGYWIIIRNKTLLVYNEQAIFAFLELKMEEPSEGNVFGALLTSAILRELSLN